MRLFFLVGGSTYDVKWNCCGREYSSKNITCEYKRYLSRDHYLKINFRKDVRCTNFLGVTSQKRIHSPRSSTGSPSKWRELRWRPSIRQATPPIMSFFTSRFALKATSLIVIIRSFISYLGQTIRCPHSCSTQLYINVPSILISCIFSGG